MAATAARVDDLQKTVLGMSAKVDAIAVAIERLAAAHTALSSPVATMAIASAGSRATIVESCDRQAATAGSGHGGS